MNAKRYLRVVLVGYILLGFACDKGSPTSPTSPTPPVDPPKQSTTLTILNGENGSPVPGAVVKYCSSTSVWFSDRGCDLGTATTNGEGKAVFDIAIPARSWFWIEAADFYPWKPARDLESGTFRLIPSRIALMRTLVWNGGEGKHAASDVYFVYPPELVSDSQSMAAAYEAVKRANNALVQANAEFKFYVVISESAVPSGAVPFKVLLQQGGGADCSPKYVDIGNGPELRGGEIVFGGLNTSRSIHTTLHEMGHAIGFLGHVPWPSLAVMADTRQVGSAEDFNSDEILAMRMMLMRPSGHKCCEVTNIYNYR
jgi:hypothetical protein